MSSQQPTELAKLVEEMDREAARFDAAKEAAELERVRQMWLRRAKVDFEDCYDEDRAYVDGMLKGTPRGRK